MYTRNIPHLPLPTTRENFVKEIFTLGNRYSHGYDTNMIYLTLNDVDHSIDRVKQRVSTGGHFVDENSIRFNFEEGLKNLEYFSNRLTTSILSMRRMTTVR